MTPLTPEEIKYLSFSGGGGKGIVYLGVVKALEEIYAGMNRRNSARIKRKMREVNPPVEGGGNDVLQPDLDEILVTAKRSKPLFRISHPPAMRPLKGISGSSAGAITAFMLAMGMSATDFDNELKKENTLEFNTILKNFINLFNPALLPKAEKPQNAFPKIFSPIINRYLEKVGEYFLKKSVVVSEFESFFAGPDDDHKVVDENSRGSIPFSNFDKPVMSALLQIMKIFITVANTLIQGIISLLNIIEKGETGAPILRRKLFLDNQTEYFLYNVMFTRGLFSGLKARDYFARLMQEYLIDKWKGYKNMNGNAIIHETSLSPMKVTFSQFFAMTGVDLVITGVNVTRKRPMYFSVTHTPEFPVIEAVQISMNVPFVFKPIWVDHEVDKKNPLKRIAYNGFWVDGGMLNNYPILAFDKLRTKALNYQGEVINYEVAVDAGGEPGNCDCVLGFRLTSYLKLQEELDKTKLKKSNNAPLLEEVEDKDFDSTIEVYDQNNSKASLRYLSDLFDTFFYPAEEGQIKTASVRRRTIEIETESLSMLDFSTPYLDEKRENENLFKQKNKLIEGAEVITMSKFGK